MEHISWALCKPCKYAKLIFCVKFPLFLNFLDAVSIKEKLQANRLKRFTVYLEYTTVFIVAKTISVSQYILVIEISVQKFTISPFIVLSNSQMRHLEQ